MELQRKEKSLRNMPGLQNTSKNKRRREKMKGLTRTLEGYAQSNKIRAGQLIKKDMKQ